MNFKQIQEVEDRMQRLERIEADFDYDNASSYVTLMKSYLRKANELRYTDLRSTSSPFFEVVPSEKLDQSVLERIDKLIQANANYSTAVRRVCVGFVKEGFATESISNPSFYEELIKLLESGGDFYEHHGSICIRDAAMISMAK